MAIERVNWNLSADISNIPVRDKRGQDIGTAHMDRNGELTITFHGSAIAHDVFELLTFGMVTGFSLSPDIIPVEPLNELCSVCRDGACKGDLYANTCHIGCVCCTREHKSRGSH